MNRLKKFLTQTFLSSSSAHEQRMTDLDFADSECEAFKLGPPS